MYNILLPMFKEWEWWDEGGIYGSQWLYPLCIFKNFLLFCYVQLILINFLFLVLNFPILFFWLAWFCNRLFCCSNFIFIWGCKIMILYFFWWAHTRISRNLRFVLIFFFYLLLQNHKIDAPHAASILNVSLKYEILCNMQLLN